MNDDENAHLHSPENYKAGESTIYFGNTYSRVWCHSTTFGKKYLYTYLYNYMYNHRFIYEFYKHKHEALFYL